ncbi:MULTISPECIES: HD domain-containing protein [Psychrilyobacter]|uniref:HD domain-containing protein n=1 Tax=Psychrilyobacter piezotolerans TaxID=2293438 RepID=A0ABX9KL38_9FUSO|nr:MULTISPECIES: HD domain-containing protein [Psychrilyobacter]MCS5422298.1 HD domain-containing protein [Psychrilyobacter sp. S5]NDI76498.1 HD domain-containing protein [Psychrilyobacter piezotolerans]RDE66089.1 HD domain-containing protein [Psychrilyobacter sp. S5]REI43267.1 HD domain-containing protein [Psychrilyobacter piezotolerans]
MNRKLIIEKTKEFVKKKLEGEGSGHDWWHIVRVYNNALDIAKKEKELYEGKIDIFVVELGALLHDIADHKFGHTDEDRREIISEFLMELEVEKKIIDHVVYVANNISFKGGKNKHKMETVEGEIVQDADRLDAIGAIGIGRTFAYGGYKKRVMYDPDCNLHIKDKGDTISHFYEKLLLLKDRMNTKTGYKKAQNRHRVMEEFLENFHSEWNGEK